MPKPMNLIRLLLFCVALSLPFGECAQTSVVDRKAQLQSELANLQQQIDAQTKILQDKQSQSASLERDISILNAKIDTTKLNVKARDLAIAGLASDISDKEKTIGVLSGKLDKEKESLAAIIRQ